MAELNLDGAHKRKLFQVRRQHQVVVAGLDIRWQHVSVSKRHG